MNILVIWRRDKIFILSLQTQEGGHEAKILPTRIGSYSISAQRFDSNQPISDDVQVKTSKVNKRYHFQKQSVVVVVALVMVLPIPISLMVKYLTFLTRITNDINNIEMILEP